VAKLTSAKPAYALEDFQPFRHAGSTWEALLGAPSTPEGPDILQSISGFC